MKHLSFFIALCCFLGCQFPVPELEEPSEEEQMLVAQLDQYYADFSSRDWDLFRSHFWDEATLTTLWQPEGTDSLQVTITTISEFIEQVPAGPGSMPVFEEQMVEAELTLEDDLAQAWVKYEARFGKPDSLVEWQGIDAFTLIRHNKEWKISSLAFSSKK